MNPQRQTAIGLVLVAVWIVLAGGGCLQVSRIMQQSRDDWTGQASLPLELNPICADPQEHTVRMRLDGKYSD